MNSFNNNTTVKRYLFYTLVLAACLIPAIAFAQGTQWSGGFVKAAGDLELGLVEIAISILGAIAVVVGIICAFNGVNKGIIISLIVGGLIATVGPVSIKLLAQSARSAVGG